MFWLISVITAVTLKKDNGNLLKTCLATVASVKLFGFPGTSPGTRDINISSITKRTQLRMFFIRQQRNLNDPQAVLIQLYRAIIESVLTSYITVWNRAFTDFSTWFPQSREASAASPSLSTHSHSFYVFSNKKASTRRLRNSATLIISLTVVLWRRQPDPQL